MMYLQVLSSFFLNEAFVGVDSVLSEQTSDDDSKFQVSKLKC